MSLKEINLPEKYNYIACFLTFGCDLGCRYCINYFGKSRLNKSILCGKKFVRGLNRISCPENFPVTLQGGEPSMHPDFIWIINNIKKSLNIDILTNLSFDINKFIDLVDPMRLRRNSPYPSIRISYHPDYMNLDLLIKKTLKLQKKGFSVGVFGILHPSFKEAVLKAKKKCLDTGIDFRTKEFLGMFKGRLYGTYLYPDAVTGGKHKKCLCRSSELIIGPDGSVFRCHHDLYKGFKPVGNLLDNDFSPEYKFRECDNLGDCNPCDMKVKTNRFQIFGHTSVGIKNIKKKGQDADYN